MYPTREQFANGLRAVLEHTGPALMHLDYVGIRGNLMFATDRYTVGIASVGEHSLVRVDEEVYLPTKEARDLLRFTRPGRVHDRTQRVELLVAADPSYDPSTGHPGLVANATNPDGLPALELHVGIREDDPNADILASEVYSLHPSDYRYVSFEKLWGVLQDIREQTFFSEEFVMQAGLIARFKAAEQQFGDRMRLRPAAPKPLHHGQRALITVGSSFIGAIAGLAELEPENDGGPAWTDSTLEDWGL